MICPLNAGILIIPYIDFKKGKYQMTNNQNPVSKLTRNMMIIDLMKTTGWTRARAVSAIEELEKSHLVYFPEAGGLRLKVVGGL